MDKLVLGELYLGTSKAPDDYEYYIKVRVLATTIMAYYYPYKEAILEVKEILKDATVVARAQHKV